MVMPVAHGLGDLNQILDPRLQRDRAFRPDHLNAGFKILNNFLAHIGRVLGEQGLWIIDIADQRNAVADRLF